MARLELWYPANNKPFSLNQAWGILNLAYQQFGFTRHNGIDIPIAPDHAVYAPIRSRVSGIYYFPNGGGHQVEFVTTEKWEVDGVSCHVEWLVMHNQEILVKVGDVVEVGQQVTIPDNTGFSTGPHTHFGVYRLNDDLSLMDKNDTNGSFDPMPYFNGYYAVDVNSVMTKLAAMIPLLTKVVQLLQQLKK